MLDQRRKTCDACGAVADFVALLVVPEYGPKSDRVPLVWQCRRCGLQVPARLESPKAV